ncbi:hypothetical protein HZB02_05025 [Candidatus Woesearchaeota archaeon]|nr:hypothetical protein [Candidatus Woesearchaeota archaeon]
MSDALWAIYDRGISNDGWLVINQQQRQELFEVVNQINPADAFFSLREEIITPAQQQSYVRFSQSIVILEQTLPEGIAYAAVKPYLTHHHPDLRGQVFGMVREHDTPLAIFDTLLYNDIYKTPVIEMTSVPLKGLDLKMYTSSR